VAGVRARAEAGVACTPTSFCLSPARPPCAGQNRPHAHRGVARRPLINWSGESRGRRRLSSTGVERAEGGGGSHQLEWREQREEEALINWSGESRGRRRLSSTGVERAEGGTYVANAHTLPDKMYSASMLVLYRCSRPRWAGTVTCTTSTARVRSCGETERERERQREREVWTEGEGSVRHCPCSCPPSAC
jgi:hypothetical protein